MYTHTDVHVHILRNFNVNSKQNSVSFYNLTKLFQSSSQKTNVNDHPSIFLKMGVTMGYYYYITYITIVINKIQSTYLMRQVAQRVEKKVQKEIQVHTKNLMY